MSKLFRRWDSEHAHARNLEGEMGRMIKLDLDKTFVTVLWNFEVVSPDIIERR